MMLYEPTAQLLLANGGDGGNGLDLPACFAHLLGSSAAANSTTPPAATPASPPAAALHKRIQRFEQAHFSSSCTVCYQGCNHSTRSCLPM